MNNSDVTNMDQVVTTYRDSNGTNAKILAFFKAAKEAELNDIDRFQVEIEVIKFTVFPRNI